MARHYCKFKRWKTDEGVVGEIIGTSVKAISYGSGSHEAAFVIEYDGSYYVKEVSRCAPAKKPSKSAK